MIIRPALQPIIQALIGLSCVYIGLVTFGNAEEFDRYFILFLLVASFFLFKNINVFGVIIILLIERSTEESIWLLRAAEIVNGEQLADLVIYKLVVYLLCFAVALKLSYDNFCKLSVVLISVSLAAEVYWYFSGYEGPRLTWGIVVITLNILTREALFYRTSITTKLFSKADPINLDYRVLKLAEILIVITALHLAEYFLRHLFGFKSVVFIYEIYPYLVHGIAVYTIWLVFQEFHSLLKPHIYRV